MIRVTILASGSSGNAVIVSTGATTILVDAGLSAKKLESALAAHTPGPQSLAGILLTHEHGDHTRGLKILCAKFGTPVYANPRTAEHLRHAGLQAPWRFFQSGSPFELGCFSVRPFSVPHDAADPVGFSVSNGGPAFAIATDLGYATRQVADAIRGAGALLVESNHDETLLHGDTKRPWSVKQRILSRHGHLSNQAAAELIASAATPSLRHIALAHLSADCNTPELARTAVREKLESTGIPLPEIHCPGTPESPLPLAFEI